MDIPHEKQFHFQDGDAIKSLKELKEKIESISYDEFYGHVNDEKNDFANWTEDVLQEKELAEKLRAVTSIVETVELLNEHLYPAQVNEAEEKLGDKDFQIRIEEELFNEAPAGEPETPVETSAEESAPSPVTPKQEVSNEVALPSKEELEYGGRLPGEPVMTDEPAHVPITEKVEKPEAHHILRQAAIGFVLGLIIGFLLSQIWRVLV